MFQKAVVPSLLLLLCLGAGCAAPPKGPAPRVDFNPPSDVFAYPNQLTWEYQFHPDGKVTTRPSDPPATYSQRCYPMVRVAREFAYHAEFRPDLPVLRDSDYRDLIQRVLSRNSRKISPQNQRIVIPGFPNFRQFTAAHEPLFKQLCGGKPTSYLQRGHWRSVLPFSKRHQLQQIARIQQALDEGRLPILHLCAHPTVALNHAVLAYQAANSPDTIQLHCYDPNTPDQPLILTFHKQRRMFEMPRTLYFKGGKIQVYQVYQGTFY